MDGVSHEPRSNAGDLAQAALQAEPAADSTGSGGAAAPLAMPLMPKHVLDLMMPSLVSADLRPGVAEVDALMRVAPQVEPSVLLDAFTDYFSAVDKATYGGDPDPLGEIIDIVAARAQPAFYEAFAAEPYPRLGEIVGRIRNWMVTFLRRKEYGRTAPALTILTQLPLTEDIIRQVKLQAVIRKLEKEPGEIGSCAKLIIEKTPAVFNEGSGTAASQAPAGPGNKKTAPPKLFGNVGMLKLGSHKRQRESSPEPKSEEDSGRKRQSPDSGAQSPREESGSDEYTAPKRAKVRKTVHWKSDDRLVSVRFFEMQGEARFKSSKNAKQQEHDEGSAMHQGIDWCTPHFIDFTNVFRPDFQSKMSSKRGGTMEPHSEEAHVQEKREARTPMAMHTPDQLPDSPKEPPAEDAAPDSNWQPRQAKETLTGAPVPPELRHKYEAAAPVTPPMGAMPTPYMNPMAAAAMAQMNPMMNGYRQFGVPPMNMNQAQMSEMMAQMQMTGMYGFQGMARR